MSARYVIKPKADLDVDAYSEYLAGAAGLDVALRFLAAAHQTFSLLATQPDIGWHSRLKNPVLKTLRVFRVAGFEKVLILYRPLPDGVEILRVAHGARNLQALFRRRETIE